MRESHLNVIPFFLSFPSFPSLSRGVLNDIRFSSC